MTTSTPANFGKQVSETFSASKQLNDQVTSFMHKTKWADLIGPAPTVILILSRLIQLGTVVDFPLIIPENPGHLKYHYFGASIAHLANSGTNAMTESRSQMEKINYSSETMIGHIKTAFQLLGRQDNNNDIQAFLPGILNDVKKASATCLEQAQKMKKEWVFVLELAQQLQEVCKSTQGETESLRLQAEAQIKYLEAQKKNEEDNFKKAEMWMETTRKKLETSHNIVKEAIDKIPDAWSIGMMGLAQGLTNAAQTGVEAFINEQCFKSQLGDLLKHKPEAVSGNGSSSTPASDKPETPKEQESASKPTRRSQDPGYADAEAIDAGFIQFKDLVNGDGGIKWDLVGSGEKSGLLGIRAVFQTYLGKEIGDRAKTLACDLMENIKVTKPEPEIKKLVETVDQLAKESRDFTLEAKITVGSLGSSNVILNGGPTVHFSNSSSWAKIDAEAAQTRVQFAQSYLATNGQLHKEATDDFYEISRRLADFKGQLDKIDAKKVNWDLVAHILHQAITCLADLNKSLHRLVLYFSTIDSIVNEAAGSKVDYLVNVITNATTSRDGKPSELVHGNFKLSSFAKQLLYDQTMGAVKITRVVERISALYIKMYDLHIQRGVELLDGMGGLSKQSKAEDLSQAEKDISAWVDESRQGMEKLVQEEEAEVQKYVHTRGEEIKEAFVGILPPTDEGIQRAIIRQERNSSRTKHKRLSDFQQNRTWGWITFNP
ncbi:hypothetical protein RhiXN_11759 [Rhizoctonia solani]|uniref:Uncharacterized protein n=1 Tax=Rhizoctonia solani TaxID=456999 RepID=A0A8H8P5T3_9AGAM|nr:uncharacterized protein RhiXN_11759 [Rhizoctonia solani]QRW24847.1 hypothetical protein RhiXN_11759 [Rhizoctonia solani]